MIGWTAAAWAGPETQTGFELDKGASAWHFELRWKDAQGRKDAIAFDLPATALLADREEETWLPRRELNDAVAAAVRRWAKGLDGVEVKVIDDGGPLQLKASGRGDVRGALRDAEAVAAEATDAWLAENRFTRTRDGAVTFDHAALVGDYDDALRPVAEALREGVVGDRAFVERALSFVQSLPYEARKRKGGDPGYRRPLALLSRDRGDCDSKTVLFLGLVEAGAPDLPLAVVYVPGHALAGVGLPREKGDRVFSAGGDRYLWAEPVGPAQLPLGQVGKGHTRRREVHPVPSR